MLLTVTHSIMARSVKSKTFTLRTTLTIRMAAKHKEQLEKRPTQTNPDLGGFVNDLLTEVLDKDEFLRIYAPSISLIGVSGNILYLKDKNQTIEIYLKDSELFCDSDKKFDCKHIHYAFAIPEIAKLNLRRTSRSSS